MVIAHCKKCGDLTAEQTVKKGIAYGVQQYRCKACYKILKAKHYQKNKIKIAERCKRYRQNNPDKVREIKKKSLLLHPRQQHQKKSTPRIYTLPSLISATMQREIKRRLKHIYGDENIPLDIQQLEMVIMQLKRVGKRKKADKIRAQ